MSDKAFSASAEPTEEGNAKTANKTFELGGRKFTAKPFVQGFALMDFLEASDGQDVTSIIAFRKFLKEATTEEEWTKIDEFARSSEKEIDIVEITKAVAELVEAYTARPTKASDQ